MAPLTAKRPPAKKPAVPLTKNGASPKPLASVPPPKSPAPAPPKRRIASKKKTASGPPTFEDISLRAYFIAEKRQQEGRWAEPSEDWAEAERQLLARTSVSDSQAHRALAQALVERQSAIADREHYARDPAGHLARLESASANITALAAALPRPLDPRLAHYLERCSYQKALAFLEGAEVAG